MPEGWKQLLEGWPWFQGEGSYPILPNSEFMPPVRLARKPQGNMEPCLLSEDDPWGWPITEYEEALTLRPGLHSLAGQILHRLAGICQGEDPDGAAEYKLRENPYWPAELSKRAATLQHEHFVLLLPLALSITQDDKARTRWTLFGNSEQGPARAFWRGFFTAPGQEAPLESGLRFFGSLLGLVYHERAESLADLSRAGFRILPGNGSDEGPLPSWTESLLLEEGKPLRGVKYLLTFRPFGDLPAPVRKKYLAGELHLLPFPGSLLFWGVPSSQKLQKSLPFATQIPLLHFLERQSGVHGIRVPQSGWFRESGPAQRDSLHRHGPLRETYKRTHRTARVHRYEDELVAAREHRLTHVLFSTRPEDIDLYNKPMARNVHLWTENFELLLDGPNANAEQIKHAAHVVAEGGQFGYRFQFPAMRVGQYELYWHRPLVAFLHPQSKRTGCLDSAPLGYITAYRVGALDQPPVELWPRLLRRAPHLTNLELFKDVKEDPPLRTVTNVHKVLDCWEVRDREPLPRSFARQLLTTTKDQTLRGWLRWLAANARDRDKGRSLAKELTRCLAPEPNLSSKQDLPEALTFGHTARREFEVEYWSTIASLSAGEFANKNNADCILDKATQAALAHPWRDLEGLGNTLLAHYTSLLASMEMTGRVLLGELPFRWHTEYAFPWMGGWVGNQQGKTYERNLLVVIPGRDRSRAVVMADHYDTAYMHDRYHESCARLSAAGADDNCSATAALLLGAPVFLELSRQGRLDCDVWLVHLTGEEYPAEGQGAIRLCQWLVERTLRLKATDGREHDLSHVRIQGLYVLDMVAHNSNKDRDVFQISPGTSKESLWLAYQAHLANQLWNASTERWNSTPERRDAGRGCRSRTGKQIPAISRHPSMHGEVRLHFDPRSTLYNTDGQAFSDAGVPVVLFMENYDIDRMGYHDTHDNMTQINLDYGAALAAIAIESVARAATEQPLRWV